MKIIYRPIGIIYDNITLDIGPYMSYVGMGTETRYLIGLGAKL